MTIRSIYRQNFRSKLFILVFQKYLPLSKNFSKTAITLHQQSMGTHSSRLFLGSLSPTHSQTTESNGVRQLHMFPHKRIIRNYEFYLYFFSVFLIFWNLIISNKYHRLCSEQMIVHKQSLISSLEHENILKCNYQTLNLGQLGRAPSPTILKGEA